MKLCRVFTIELKKRKTVVCEKQKIEFAIEILESLSLTIGNNRPASVAITNKINELKTELLNLKK